MSDEAPLTIVALGDSKTEGVGDAPGWGGYPARLDRLVAEVRPGTRVITLGRLGWGSAELIAQGLPAAVAAQPTIALVWIGSNDLWAHYAPEEAGPELARYAAHMDILLGTLRQAGARILVGLLDDQSQRPAVVEDPDWTPAARAHLSARVAGYNAALAAKADEHGAATVDFYHTTIFSDPSTLAGDGTHPNAAGYDHIARIWFAALRPLLNKC
jgi:lysophospholipase L1-like esterase